jgi:hypothetical protein
MLSLPRDQTTFCIHHGLYGYPLSSSPAYAVTAVLLRRPRDLLTALHRIATGMRLPITHVRARVSHQGVIARAAREDVIAGATTEGVIAAAAVNGVMAPKPKITSGSSVPTRVSSLAVPIWVTTTPPQVMAW